MNDGTMFGPFEYFGFSCVFGFEHIFRPPGRNLDQYLDSRPMNGSHKNLAEGYVYLVVR